MVNAQASTGNGQYRYDFSDCPSLLSQREIDTGVWQRCLIFAVASIIGYWAGEVFGVLLAILPALAAVVLYNQYAPAVSQPNAEVERLYADEVGYRLLKEGARLLRARDRLFASRPRVLINDPASEDRRQVASWQKSWRDHVRKERSLAEQQRAGLQALEVRVHSS